MFNISTPLYAKGNSLATITDLMGFPVSSIHKCLRGGGLTLCQRTKDRIPDEKRQHFKKAGPPPSGFCNVEGRLDKDAKEHQALRIIHQQWIKKIISGDRSSFKRQKL